MGGSPDGILLLPPGASSTGLGLLEIKVISGGKGVVAKPQDYYMSQLQGLMEIYDLDWSHIISYAPGKGYRIFHVPRDREYWELLLPPLREMWFDHIQPARAALAAGAVSKEVARERFRPPRTHRSTETLVQMSKEMAEARSCP